MYIPELGYDGHFSLIDDTLRNLEHQAEEAFVANDHNVVPPYHAADLWLAKFSAHTAEDFARLKTTDERAILAHTAAKHIMALYQIDPEGSYDSKRVSLSNGTKMQLVFSLAQKTLKCTTITRTVHEKPLIELHLPLDLDEISDETMSAVCHIYEPTRARHIDIKPIISGEERDMDPIRYFLALQRIYRHGQPPANEIDTAKPYTYGTVR